MGIPCFYSYIIKNHNKIICEFMKNTDNLYIDSNSIIYDCVNDLSNILFKVIIMRMNLFN